MGRPECEGYADRARFGSGNQNEAAHGLQR
jgi:hypothetical protein